MVRLKSLLFLLAISFLLVQCDDDDDVNGSPDDSAKPGKLQITIDHKINGNDLIYDTILYTNQAGDDFGVTKLEYIITDFRFYKNDSDFEEVGLSQYINPKQTGTKQFTVEDVPAGNYERIAFRFGIDSAQNQAGSLPNNPNYSNMGWPMEGGGYHYMRMNGIYDSSGYQDGFTTHLGPSMGKDYSFEVTLANSGIEIEGNTWNLTITMKMANWYKNPNTYSFADLENEGIMGNPEVQAILKANGHDVFKLTNKADS